jgi:hypothetical protein
MVQATPLPHTTKTAAQKAMLADFTDVLLRGFPRLRPDLPSSSTARWVFDSPPERKLSP